MNREKVEKQAKVIDTLVVQWYKNGKSAEEIVDLISQMITVDTTKEMQDTMSAMAVQLILDDYMMQEEFMNLDNACDSCEMQETCESQNDESEEDDESILH